MDRDQIVVRLTRVFHEVFADPSIRLHDAMKARDVASWDSMNNIRLILSIEQEFALRFRLREINNVPDVGELIRLLQAKLAQ